MPNTSLLQCCLTSVVPVLVNLTTSSNFVYFVCNKQLLNNNYGVV